MSIFSDHDVVMLLITDCDLLWPGNGWADGVLAALSYNSNPQKLQTIIRRIFTLATSQISIKVLLTVYFSEIILITY